MGMAGGEQQDQGIVDINITPFVDVVLVLLVIFMVAAPIMVKESLNVQLPKSMTSDLSTQAATVGFAITKDGQYVLAGEIQTLESLKIKLQDIASREPNTNFLISADADARHADLVRAIDLLKRYNLSRFALQVERVKEEP